MPGTTQTIGARIRSRRIARGLSRMELALRLETNPLHIYRWESGRVAPGLVSAMQLAQALEVTLDWLVLGRESKYRGKTRGKRASSSSAPTSPASSANG